jgi:hypothetical protein
MSKKLPDYLNLPFEMYYDTIWTKGFEFILNADRRTNSEKDYVGVIVQDIKTRGVYLRSENKGNGSLAYVLAGMLGEYQPEWLTTEDNDDSDVKNQEVRSFHIKEGRLVLDEYLDFDELEEQGIDYGASASFTSLENSRLNYLVLDADNSSVVVDMKGFRLAEDDTRLDEKPLVTFNNETVAHINLENVEESDVMQRLAQMINQTNAEKR